MASRYFRNFLTSFSLSSRKRGQQRDFIYERPLNYFRWIHYLLNSFLNDTPQASELITHCHGHSVTYGWLNHFQSIKFSHWS